METTDADGAPTRESPEIERLKKQLHQEHEMYLRALADFENYRKRVESARASAAQKGKREIILSLLDFVDGFDLALQHIDGAPLSLSEGLKAIYRRLQNLLERQGVTTIHSLGEKFDPRLHEAIDSVPGDKAQAGTIVGEVQKGYRWDDQLLRPSRVRVAF